MNEQASLLLLDGGHKAGRLIQEYIESWQASSKFLVLDFSKLDAQEVKSDFAWVQTLPTLLSPDEEVLTHRACIFGIRSLVEDIPPPRNLDSKTQLSIEEVLRKKDSYDLAAQMEAYHAMLQDPNEK